jgi:hypothetical protein
MTENSKSTYFTGDDDILSLAKDVFKISRLKELLIREIRSKLLLKFSELQENQGTIGQLFKQVKIGEELIETNRIQFQFVKDCELLSMNTKNWQQGKVKFTIYISPVSKQMDEVNVEFYPEIMDERQPLETMQNGFQAMTSLK